MTGCRWATLSLAGCLLAGAGCREVKTAHDVEKPVPVGGTILLAGGQPLVGGRVSFYPLDPMKPGKPVYQGWGTTRPDGSYQITSFQPNDGVAPGSYSVAITPPEDGVRPGSNADNIPAKYRDPATSELKFDVKADGTNKADFTLQ